MTTVVAFKKYRTCNLRPIPRFLEPWTCGPKALEINNYKCKHTWSPVVSGHDKAQSPQRLGRHFLSLTLIAIFFQLTAPSGPQKTWEQPQSCSAPLLKLTDVMNLNINGSEISTVSRLNEDSTRWDAMTQKQCVSCYLSCIVGMYSPLQPIGRGKTRAFYPSSIHPRLVFDDKEFVGWSWRLETACGFC